MAMDIEELRDLLSQDIKNEWDEKRSFAGVLKQIDLLVKLSGWEKKPEVKETIIAVDKDVLADRLNFLMGRGE